MTTEPGVPEPLISVLLPTNRPWPVASVALESLLAQREPPSFEILLLDGHGEGLPRGYAHPAVRWIRLPGLDSFELRRAGIANARGDIVAITEDHCVAAGDWLASIAAAHRLDSADAIIGAVVNHPDSARAAIDRANFILTFAGLTPGSLAARRRRLPVPTNLSLKRLAASGLEPRAGDLEYRWLASLQSRGRLSASESIVLHHRQSWGRKTWMVHLASGRSYGAEVHRASLRARLGWWLRFPLIPFRLLRLVLPEVQRGAGGAIDLIAVLALIAANLLGQIQGAAFGAGSSRNRL